MMCHIWASFLLKKEFEFKGKYYVFIIVWINLYLDILLLFYKGVSFEYSNRITLYISCLSFLMFFQYLKPDFNFHTDIKKFFKNLFDRSNKNSSEQPKELPIYYQEYENLAKSVQINQIKSDKKNRGFILILFLTVLSILFLYTEVYVYLKKLQSFWEKSQVLDFLSYPAFIYSLFAMIKKENAHWYYKNSSFPISVLLKRYYSIILFLMGVYDIRRPRNFVRC